MKENEKLINAVIDLAQEMKGMRKDMNTQLGDMNTQLADINAQLEGLNHRVDKLEKEQHKTNILLAEHSRSIIKMAEKISIVADHETRIIRLEDITLVKEPNAEYKKRKK